MSIGVEYDQKLAELATNNVVQRGLQDKVCAYLIQNESDIIGNDFLLCTFPQITILHDNVLNVDIGSATAIFVYLVPEGMLAMRSALLEALDRGARIVAYGGSIALC